MAGEDKRIELEFRVVHEHFERAGHVLVRSEHREILKSHGLRAFDRHGDKRRRGFEPNAHEHDLTLGMRSRERERVERRVHDFDRTPLRLLGEQARRRTGNTRHVAEGRDGDLGDAGKRDHRVDVAVACDANGTPGTRCETQSLRHEVADAVARDRHRVGAAHFHERGALRGEPADRLDQATRELRVLEGGEIDARRIPPHAHSATSSSCFTSSIDSFA